MTPREHEQADADAEFAREVAWNLLLVFLLLIAVSALLVWLVD